MKVLNEKNQIREYVPLFIETYSSSPIASLYNAAKRLASESLHTLTAERVAEIIGTDSWVHQKKCDECGSATWDIIEFGNNQTGKEELSSFVCIDCIKKSLEMYSYNKIVAFNREHFLGTYIKG